jgi:LAO/AO transport system kinase
MTDTTCFVAQPASGDSIQFLKAGIMEVPHVLVVNKEDIGMAARKTLSELRSTLRRQTDADGWRIPALSVSATKGTGIEKLTDTLEAHRIWLVEHQLLVAHRQRFQAVWVIKRLREQYGNFGIEMLGGEDALFETLARQSGSPFEQYNALRDRFLVNWKGAV